MKIDSRGTLSVNMTRVVVISVLLFCCLADSARIKRRIASRAYDNREGEGPGLWSREPNANPTGPNSYDNRGGEGPGLWSREPNANPTGPNSYDNRAGEGPGLWSRKPNANPTGPNSYDNRGGEGPGLWSREPNANPTGPNSYDNRGGEGPGLWSREPNANPTGPNSYDNRGGEGPGLWSREPNANPTGPNSYDNRGGEGPGLWSRKPNANPTGPNSYDNRGGEGPGLWSREPNANPTGPNSYDNRGGEGPGLWSREPNANPTGPNSYDNRGGEGPGLWSRKPNANPTGPNSYDNRGGEGPGLWSREPNANPTGPNSYDNRGGEGPGLWSREPNANPTGPNSYDNRGGEGPGLWSREPNANPTGPNSYDNRGGEEPGLYSSERYANPTSYSGQTCASMDGSCVATEGECANDVVPGLGCNETPLCCLPPVCKNTNTWVPEHIGGLEGLKGPIPGTMIVGGTEAARNRWPWQVSLQTSQGFHFCGGSLLNDQWVLTAAHCLASRSIGRVVLGDHDLTTHQGTEVIRGASRVVEHPSFQNHGSYPNDIALVRLDTPVSFSAAVQPIYMSNEGDSFNNNECWITGWGETRNTGDSTKLNELVIKVIDQQTCARQWQPTAILNTHICVGDGETGACSGDSGGPLSCMKNGKWTLAGVTSFGVTGCETGGSPDVYTRVSMYRPWIEYVIRRGGRE